MKLNKKGFTLVELLAVIVVLALLMVVAASSIGSALDNSKKNTLKTETQKVLTSVYQEIESSKMLSATNLLANIKVDNAATAGLTEKGEVGTCSVTSHTTRAACTGASKTWTVTYYYLKGKDGDYTYEVRFDATGGITKYLVSYKSEYHIKKADATAIVGAPKVPDDVTIGEGLGTI